MDRIRFDTEDGLSLEGELRRPEGTARGSAVLCHPHPRQGGSKDHPLLWAVRNDLSARELVVLAFNFRGVMGSEGSYGGGTSEVIDARAAISRARSEAGGPTLVAGWSFGAHVALREAIDDDRVRALALIGFPLSDSSLVLPDLPNREALKAFDRPVLLVAGAADPFCPVPDLKGLARRLGKATVHVIPGTDHFFWRLEREAARVVGEFAEHALFDRGP
jgi:alpha/beta superfamily hydrolase